MEGKYLYEIGDLVKVRDDIDRNMQYRMQSWTRTRDCI
mgnify:CR=1 FL=1